MSEARYQATTAESAYSVLTPYLIPPELAGRKIVNLGDGFILRAIERLVGRFPPQQAFTPRIAPAAAARSILAQAPAVILAGANQLNDRYTIWPGLSAEEIRASTLRFIPFGIGVHGEPGHNEGLSKATREVLIAIHERITCSSWRCPRTVAWLSAQIPEISDQLVMTGCPVLYDAPLLDGKPFGPRMKRIAVTVTERGDFWSRETATLDFVAKTFPRAERFLVLHQNYSPPTRLEWVHHRLWPRAGRDLNDYQKLRRYAVRLGFKIVVPESADHCLAFYETVDAHLGSRLHAHLLCLSRAKRSWLIPVDGRALGMAEFLQFPLCQPHTLEAEMGFDFETVRFNARRTFTHMQHFIKSLPA